MSKIFLSYCRKDSKIVNSIVRALKAANHKIWLDKEIEGGGDIPEQIFSNIIRSDIFCVVLSPNAIKSNWVKKELSAAVKMGIDYEKPDIIPLYVKKTSIPEMIYERKYIDFVKEPFDSAIGNLLNTVKRLDKRFSFVETFFKDTTILSKALLLKCIEEEYKFRIFVPLIPPPKFSHLCVYIGEILSELIIRNQKISVLWEDYSYKQLYQDQYGVSHMRLKILEKRMRMICSKTRISEEDLSFYKESEFLSKLRNDINLSDEFSYLKNTLKIEHNYDELQSISYYQISSGITPYNIERILFEVFVSYNSEFRICADFIMGGFDRKIVWNEIMEIERLKQENVPKVLIFDKIYDIEGKLKFNLISNSLIYPFQDDERSLEKKALTCLASRNAKHMMEKYFLRYNFDHPKDIVDYFLSIKMGRKADYAN